MHKFLIGILFALPCAQCVKGQGQLTLLKENKIITRFEEGEYIRFKRKGDEGFIRAIIIGIHPGFFIVGKDTIFTYDVEKVDVSKKILGNYKISSLGKGLLQAGAFLLLIDLFNQTLILDKKYNIENPATTAAFGLIGTGAIMQVVNNDYFKAGRRKKLTTLNLK